MARLTKLDLAGLKCPLPALRTRKALKALTPGDRRDVIEMGCWKCGFHRAIGDQADDAGILREQQRLAIG